MKATLLALTVLVSGSAFAGEVTTYGSIFFQSASTWIPANKVCQQDGMLYSTEKAAVAVEYCNTSSESNCTTVLKALAQPMKSVKSVCAKDNGGENEVCSATKLVPFNQGTVKVTTATQDGKAQRVIGTYTVPACATAPVPAN